MGQQRPNGAFRLRHQGFVTNRVDGHRADRLPVHHQSLVLSVIVAEPIQSIGPGESGFEPLEIATQHGVHGVANAVDDPGSGQDEGGPTDVLKVLGHFVRDPSAAIAILVAAIQIPLTKFVDEIGIDVRCTLWKTLFTVGFGEQTCCP